MRRDFRRRYLASDDPWRQSGWGSTPERWRLAREVILSAVERSGTFVDIGCANGLLLECLIAWATERGVVIEPHGIDLVPELIGARAQTPSRVCVELCDRERIHVDTAAPLRLRSSAARV